MPGLGHVCMEIFDFSEEIPDLEVQAATLWPL